MATPLRISDKAGKSLSDPAQEEARCAHSLFIEKIEKLKKVCLDLRGQGGPLGQRRSGRDLENMKPVFDVDGKNRFHWLAPGLLMNRRVTSLRFRLGWARYSTSSRL